MGTALSCGNQNDLKHGIIKPLTQRGGISQFDSNAHNWVKIFSKFAKKIQQINGKCGKISQQGLMFVINKFKYLYLNIDEKNEFMSHFSKMLAYNFGKVSTANDFTYLHQISKKLGCLQNRVRSKHKHALQQLKFLINQDDSSNPSFVKLKFDLTQTQVQIVAKQVKKLFTNNQKVFAIQSLYFKIAVQNKLKKCTYKKVQEDYLNLLDFLSKKYSEIHQKVYSPLFNLHISTNRCTQRYFRDLFDIYDQNIKINQIQQSQQKEQFKKLISDVQKFKNNLLNPYDIDYTMSKFVNEDVKNVIQQSNEEIIKYIQNQFYFKQTSNAGECLKLTNTAQIIFSYPDYQKLLYFVDSIKDQTIKNSVNILNLKADALKIQGKYNESQQVYKILAGNFQNDSNPNVQTATALNKTAMIQMQNGNLIQTLQLYEKGLKIYQEVQGVQSLNAASVLNNIAIIYIRKVDYQKALEYVNESLRIKEKLFGKNHYQTTYSLDLTADVYTKQAQYNKALQLYEKVLAIKEKYFGTDQNLQIVTSYYKIGSLYDDISESDKALQVYKKCLDIQQKILGSQNIQVSRVMNKIALVYKGKKQYQKALQLLDKCLKIETKILGQNNISHAAIISNVGLTYNQMGQYDKAISFFQKSLELQQKTLGQQNIDVAITYINIGLAYKNRADYVNAQFYYMKCLKIREKQLGKQNLDVAQCLYNLGMMYFAMNDFMKAFQYLKNSFCQRIDILGENHSITQITLRQLERLSYAIQQLQLNSETTADTCDHQ